MDHTGLGTSLIGALLQACTLRHGDRRLDALTRLLPHTEPDQVRVYCDRLEAIVPCDRIIDRYIATRELGLDETVARVGSFYQFHDFLRDVGTTRDRLCQESDERIHEMYIERLNAKIRDYRGSLVREAAAVEVQARGT